MGLPKLAEYIERCEEIVPIAKLAEEHFMKHKRPLKIAVDEADWRFNNVSPEQVAVIRRKVPAANPVEKAMFYRICNLLTLNIELVFVFDGPKCPPKRGRSAGRNVHYRDRQLLKDVLRYFGIPFLEAPSEAEAQCCHLQTLGLVDAVWSQDSDYLMLGCSLWIRDHRISREEGYDNRNKAHTKKDAKTIRVVRAEDLQKDLRLRREGIVLFAMLVGGDYNTSGLERCGPATAIKAAQAGIGIRLCQATNQEACDQWRARVLLPFFKKECVNIAVPDNFPRYQTLQYYNDPLVDAAVDSNLELRRSYVRKVREIELIDTTSTRFNTWGMGYMDWIGPTLLTKALVERTGSSTLANEYSIELVKTRRPRNPSAEDAADLVRTITFSPFKLTSLTEAIFAKHPKVFWSAKDVPFDPNYRVKCEMPTYLLTNVVSPEVLYAKVAEPKPKAPRRRRSRSDDPDEQNTSPAKRSRGFGRPPKPKSPAVKVMEATRNALGTCTTAPHQNGPIDTERDYLTLDDDELRVPWKRAGEIRHNVNDLDQEDVDLQLALRLSREEQQAIIFSAKKTRATTPRKTEVIDLTEL